MLFISPNLLVGENNEVPATGNPGDFDDTLESAAPPRYDEHQYDRLFEGIDQDDFTSPAHSQAATPQVLSRSGSVENLQAGGGEMRNSNSGSSTPHHLDVVSPRGNATGSGSRSKSQIPVGLLSATQFGHEDLVARLHRADLNSNSGSQSHLAVLVNAHTPEHF